MEEVVVVVAAEEVEMEVFQARTIIDIMAVSEEEAAIVDGKDVVAATTITTATTNAISEASKIYIYLTKIH